MYELRLKPLSVNKAYKGRKFRTPEHKLFKDKAHILLKNLNLEPLKPKQEFFVIYKFHISANSDWDNCVKTVQDAICEALKTDDRYISGAYVRKIRVKRGDERIEFDFFTKEYDMLQAIQHLDL